MPASVLLVLLILGGCYSSELKPPLKQPSWLDPATAPHDATELRYLIDPGTGAVIMEVPPEILTSVRVQLFIRGHEAEARQLDALYDRQTGGVRDSERAKVAEARIRGLNVPPITSSTQQPVGNPPPAPPAFPGRMVGVAPGMSGGGR